ncbi:MAG: 2-succinyl-5-enolpyruvyl-6-hydroxy-3-cyclohexene-1-carboxylic-acid synthase [Rickettsiales bacterium]|nr:2-succinyl-5-enolpyruvyl-6-hydroxy-3-cyclohexene-1-carboxylic-acid synthase [Rickettsiales bacterium]
MRLSPGAPVEMSPSNLQTEWARLWADTVVQAGVGEVVVSPGSRSTPFVAACLERPELRVHSIVDERSAAFFALGQARVTGAPTMLLCTSGTAGAHYFPAVIEAFYAALPLLVVTADRPPELQGCGASQTIDQRDLYGRHVRSFIDLGVARADARSLAAMRSQVGQAIRQCCLPVPGPVHINAPARKPLEPVHAEDAQGRALARTVEALCRQPLVQELPVREEPEIEGVAELARSCRELPKGIIVAGPAAMEQRRVRQDVAALSELCGYPVLADLASQLGGGQPGHAPLDALFSEPCSELLSEVQLVLQVGRAPTSSRFGRWLDARPDLERWVLAERGVHDPWRSARAHLRGSLHETLPLLVAELAAGGPLPGDRQRLPARMSGARLVLDRLQQELIKLPTHRNSEARVVRSLLQSLPDDALLVLGNSLAIRLADLWGGLLPAGVSVLSQRGVAGIDGLLSGAVGSALSSGRPTALLLGDVSMLHDLSALGLAALDELGASLLVVVLNNEGGRIFNHLPIAEVHGGDSAEMRLWTTPHQLRFEQVAAMFSRTYQQRNGSDELEPLLVKAWTSGGLTLLELVVPRHASVAAEEALLSALEQCRAELLEGAELVSSGGLDAACSQVGEDADVAGC